MNVGRRPRGLGPTIALVIAAVACATAGGCASGGGNKMSAQSESERYLRLGYVQLERGQTQQAHEIGA